ncbi:MAG: HAD family phosphatase [Desulfuromonadales bacterium]|nr:HAD family phosphatase [Desulfuromonadales bacterium]
MKPGAAAVNYIVFDLGKVLIDYSYVDFFALLREHGVQAAKVEDFLLQAGLHDYEHGYLACDDFLAGMNSLLARPLAQEQLRQAWNGLFAPIPEMLELAAELKNHYPVYLLSNIGKLHWDFLSATYALDAYCHDRLASFEAGAMKPAATIYHAAQQRFALEPAYTLFIDDKPENIRGAIACGWQGFVHRDPAATRDCLYKLTGFAN